MKTGKDCFTREEIMKLMSQLSEIYDVVRLVDPVKNEVCILKEDGTEEREPYKCYAVWHKTERCANCISMKVCAQNEKKEKFEFMDDEMYHVTSCFVYVDEKGYALEIVSHITDETLFDAVGQKKFNKTIQSFNNKLYHDSLTGLYNRRYYDEQLCYLKEGSAIAVADVDDFKKVNDTMGHLFGDTVIQKVSLAIQNSVRSTDKVIRYGGDEILICFMNMKTGCLQDTLEKIKKNVSLITFSENMNQPITISAGGAYREETDQMFELADRRLYLAKRTKNCIVTEGE